MIEREWFENQIGHKKGLLAEVNQRLKLPDEFPSLETPESLELRNYATALQRDIEKLEAEFNGICWAFAEKFGMDWHKFYKGVEREINSQTKLAEADRPTMYYIIPPYRDYPHKWGKNKPFPPPFRQGQVDLVKYANGKGQFYWLGYASEIDTIYWMGG